MLVLRRKQDERFMLTLGGKVVTVTFLGVRGGRGEIGIEAPPEVQIDREEVYVAKRDASKRIVQRD